MKPLSSRRIALPFLAAMCLGSSGCIGTIWTRQCAPVVGWAPYSAVTADIHVMVYGESSCRAGPVEVLAVFSIPLDLVLDSVLLLPDLVAAAMGFKKGEV